MTCISCKWYLLKCDKAMRRREGVSMVDIETACEKCLETFRRMCAVKPHTCVDCEWKDRTLPFAQRSLRCRACAEEYAKEAHECGSCMWNDPKRAMPTDETMAHCTACLKGVDGKTRMNCVGCEWSNTPKVIRVRHCAACSLKFSANPKVISSTNELSNKGQIIESYDNHSDMKDDRDIVHKIDHSYIASRDSKSKDGAPHPVYEAARVSGMTTEEVARNAYDLMLRFIYELTGMSDIHALLFLSTIRGEKQSEFARAHNLSVSSVNMMYKRVLGNSDVFQRFILLTKGTLNGTRGRKTTKRSLMARLKKRPQGERETYAGACQMSLLGEDSIQKKEV